MDLTDVQWAVLEPTFRPRRGTTCHRAIRGTRLAGDALQQPIEAARALPELEATIANHQSIVGSCALSIRIVLNVPLPGTTRNPHCSLIAVLSDGASGGAGNT